MNLNYSCVILAGTKMTKKVLNALKKATDEICNMPHEEFLALLEKQKPFADNRFIAGTLGINYDELEEYYDKK